VRLVARGYNVVIAKAAGEARVVILVFKACTFADELLVVFTIPAVRQIVPRRAGV
jgi:hypothetical protein